MFQNYHPEFLTATILEWKPFLANNECKMIVVDAMQWLVKKNNTATLR